MEENNEKKIDAVRLSYEDTNPDDEKTEEDRR